MKRHQSHQETGENTTGRENKVTVIEAVAFIPFTPGSELRRRLQEADDLLTQSIGRPRMRFVERGGVEIVKEVVRPNPWAKETYCPRKTCVMCETRLKIEAEKEAESIAKVTGNREEGMVSIPKSE